MNKTAKIIISILVVICIFFILLAQIQRNEAEKQVATAIALQKKVNEKSELVKLQKSRSERLAAEAIEAHAQAEENAAQAKLAQKEAERVMLELQKQVATAIALQKEVYEQSVLVKKHKSRSERLAADAIEAHAQAEEFKQELLKCQSGK